MKIHARTLEIFELLSKGSFICSNSVDEEQRKQLYEGWKKAVHAAMMFK